MAELHPPTRKYGLEEKIEVSVLMDKTIDNFERLAEIRGLTVEQEVENALEGMRLANEDARKRGDTFDARTAKLYDLPETPAAEAG